MNQPHLTVMVFNIMDNVQGEIEQEKADLDKVNAVLAGRGTSADISILGR